MRFFSLISSVVAFLFVGSASASQLTIFWDDNSSNESGFKIERSVNGNSFVPLASTGPGVTSFIDPTVAAGSSYAYRIQAFNASTVSAFSNIASSTVPPPPAIPVTTPPVFVVQPTGMTRLIGENVALGVSVTGSPTPTLQWFKDGTAISGAVGSTLSLSSVTLSHAGTYSVVAKNSAGSSASQGAVVSVSGEKPVITTQPIARTVVAGEDVSFVATVSGDLASTFQWTKNNIAIEGATSATLNLADVTQADAGTYSVVVTNLAGSTTSTAATLALSEPGRITHVIAKAVSSGWGYAALQMTFNVSGGPKSVLFRAIGPSLAAFTSGNLLVDPTLKVSGGTIVYTNNNWGGSAILKDAFARVGAFPLADTSKDSAVLMQLPARKYSALLGGKATGMALAELYDADFAGASSSHLSEVTVRGVVGKGSEALTVGFEIGGDTPVRLLVRAIGPSLPNVQGQVKDPRLDIYKGSTLIRTNDNWGGSASMINLFKQVGASPLATTSKDCATEITLSPGIYSAVISGVNGTTGLALLEFRTLP
jgi:hypothetical protein